MYIFCIGRQYAFFCIFALADNTCINKRDEFVSRCRHCHKYKLNCENKILNLLRRYIADIM